MRRNTAARYTLRRITAMRHIFFVLMVFMIAAGAAAAELLVCAAASLTDTFQEIGNAFGPTHHLRVLFSLFIVN